MTDSHKNLLTRITLDIILFVGVFTLPFWALVLLAFAGLIYFKNYYEFMVVFAMSDFLYAVQLERFDGSVYVLTIASVIVFILANFIKNKILLLR